jgi:hypothetical protein
MQQDTLTNSLQHKGDSPSPPPTTNITAATAVITANSYIIARAIPPCPAHGRRHRRARHTLTHCSLSRGDVADDDLGAEVDAIVLDVYVAPVLGAAQQHAHAYASGKERGAFACLGGQEVPWIAVNDNYCDCRYTEVVCWQLCGAPPR